MLTSHHRRRVKEERSKLQKQLHKGKTFDAVDFSYLDALEETMKQYVHDTH